MLFLSAALLLSSAHNATAPMIDPRIDAEAMLVEPFEHEPAAILSPDAFIAPPSILAGLNSPAVHQFRKTRPASTTSAPRKATTPIVNRVNVVDDMWRTIDHLAHATHHKAQRGRIFD